MFKQAKLLFLYTETPLHVGSGSSLSTVDLPIQRERHTELPMIQSTGIKGKIRSAFESNGLQLQLEFDVTLKTLICRCRLEHVSLILSFIAVLCFYHTLVLQEKRLLHTIFGPDSNNASDHAGALSPGDGRLLLFPVRSLAGVFAWITCPLVISRFQRDLKLVGQSQNWTIPTPNNTQALVPNDSHLVIDAAVVLEEFSFESTVNEQVTTLANWLADNALSAGDEYGFWRDKLTKDLVVVSNDVFKDFCKFSTDIVSRTKLNQETKTVDQGALWTEENLPADALLYTPLFACDPRMDKAEIPKLQDQEKEIDAALILQLIQDYFTNGHQRLQLGGNETVGRGIVATRIV
jgi:CRISPR-associated protein Cmr4